MNTLVLINYCSLGSEPLQEDTIAKYDRFILVDTDLDILNELAILLESKKKYVVILDKLEGLLRLFKSYGQKRRQHIVLESYPKR